MLHLLFAPSANELVPPLLRLLRDGWRDPFTPPTLIVPNPSFGKWLRMSLATGSGAGRDQAAAAFGCVANLPMPTLERYLWDTLKPGPDMRQLDVEHLQQVICALLDEALVERPVFAPLCAYLVASGGIDPLKRVQLAARVAHQFLEYEYNRPSVWGDTRWRMAGIDASWLGGRRYLGVDTAGEEWQSELYRRAHACIDKAKATEWDRPVRYVSLPHLYRTRREKGMPDRAAWTVAPGPVFLVGVSKVSHFHRNLLVEISQQEGVEMHVLLTNPCAEFWEDVNTSRGSVRRTWRHNSKREVAGIPPRSTEDYGKQELADFAGLPPDHALLELWGNAGKENIFLWCQQAQWDFDYHCPAWADTGAAPDTLLGALQYSLLRRQRAFPVRDGGWRPDGTLQVLACPDRGREIEEIREQILDLVHDGRLEKLNEAVVYLPSPADYVPQIQRVFGAYRPGEPGHIPFGVLGAPGSDSVFAQGVHALLELVQGHFDRAHVFGLLRNPIAQATRRIPAGRVAVWEQWAANLGIYRGYNRQHRAEMGDEGQTLTDAHTFELGMARMLMGDLAAGPAALGFTLRPGNAPAGAELPVYPYRDFDTSDRGQVEQFCGTVEALYGDAGRVREALEQGLHEARRVLLEVVRAWLAEIPETGLTDPSAEGTTQREFFDALLSIDLQASAAGRATLSMDELIALAGGCLPEELRAHAQAWTSGVTFAPLRPGMVVPHRVVFAAGLGAADFPGTSERPSWDLLSHHRIVGDSDRVRDNRFAFLELIHAARERLVLSFRARDMQKEADLQPASVVLELETYLREQGLAAPGSDGTERCAVRRDVPWIVHEALDERAAEGREHGTWDAAEVELARLSAGRRYRHRHELAPARHAAGTAVAPLRATLYDLRWFFANPLEYHLRRTLGIELDEEPGTMSATDEPLDSGALALSSLQKTVWTEVLRRVFPVDRGKQITGPAELMRIAEHAALQAYSRHVAGGGAPEAQCGAMEESAVMHWARQCVGPVLGLTATFPNHMLLENTDLALGREQFPGELAVTLADGQVCAIECRHGLVLAPRSCESDGPAGIIATRKDGTARENPDLWLAGVVQWLAERNARTPLQVRLVQLNRGSDGAGLGCSSVGIRQAADKGHDPGTWLAGLLAEMLVGRCTDHLPFAAVQAVHKREGWDGISGLAIEEKLEGRYPAYHSYLPAFALTDARIPQVSDDDIRQRAMARFAPMLEAWLYE